MTKQTERVKNYYDSTILDFMAWASLRGNNLHWGYYDESVKTHKESLAKMNEVLAKFAGISANDRVLDAGCGWGGTSVWLAKNIGCHVTGITVVSHQIKRARRFAQKQGVTDKTNFLLEDYTHTTLPSQSFDVVIGIESIVHAENKKDFVKEAFRLLKPRGRLLIEEYLLPENQNFSSQEKELLNMWLRGWAMPNLLTLSAYQNIFETVGFRNFKTHDLNENIKLSVKHLETFSKLTWLPAIFRWKTKTISETHFRNLEAVVAMIKAHHKGLWKCIAVIGEKP
ncbi:MAG: class I SAM-dependent methyltransferase [bacterium]|nr:class I SAM-dependent methyltransferase [bacterium]